MKKGAIFDMDGTLFDTEKLFQKTWKELAKERGASLDEDFAGKICGTSGESTYAVLREYFGEDADARYLDEECHIRVLNMLKSEVPVKPGVREILEYFKSRGVPMAVASSSGAETIKSNLDISGFDHFFAETVSGKGLKRGKPAPDIFLLAAKKLGLPADDCYVFEDSISGIEAAYAAGASPVMVPDVVKPDEEMKKISSGIFEDMFGALSAIREGLI